MERKPAELIADRLHSAAIHVLRRVRRRDDASGVGPAQLSALSVLVFGGATTLGGLAAAEQVRPPTMSRIVASLKSSGLVETISDQQDARRLRIRATAKGTKLLQRARERRIDYLAEHLDRLLAQELEQLNSAIDVIRKVLEEWE